MTNPYGHPPKKARFTKALLTGFIASTMGLALLIFA
jgi:hypothetical protein